LGRGHDVRLKEPEVSRRFQKVLDVSRRFRLKEPEVSRRF
jgi:hypothetical protein